MRTRRQHPTFGKGVELTPGDTGPTLAECRGSIPSRSGCEAGAGSAMLVRRAIACARGLGFPALKSLFQNIDDQMVD